ncbi:hypothetical protein [Bradyrhizobium sp. BRP56]|uniref:hypothetical protein n=1 Tax=Bradyrhizobium sp. BRP56 TaxID=2793819 RepID=UPI001CD6FC2D|nr:hypothetical protein [Bradyrhizobium sp. BRP56]MCA1399356.1 hypothetical protein [Bradyrhizobium sp. BRP56]
MTNRDQIIQDDLLEMMRESASTKRAYLLTVADINSALVRFIEGHDAYAVFWTEGGVERRLIIRWTSRQDDAPWRGNAAFVQDHATALMLRVACRADDNIAPDIVSMFDMTPEMVAYFEEREATLRSEGKPSELIVWQE